MRAHAIEFLEKRILLAASPLIVNGGTGNNTFYIRKNSDGLHLDLWINAGSPGSGTPTQSNLISQISSVTVNGLGINDKLAIDFSKGNPFPSTVSFAGGSGTNALTISGATGTALGVGSTAVTFGSTAINYSNTQNILVSGGSGNDTLTQTAQPSAAVVFNGGAGNDTLNINGGTFTLSGDPASVTSNLTVNDNSALFFAAAATGSGINARHLAELNIGAGATATVDGPLSANDRAVLVTNALTINASGKLDPGSNDLIVHNGNLSQITAAIATGYNHGSWKGAAGIVSLAAAFQKTHALGVELNNGGAGKTFTSSFDGQTAITTDVLVKYTFAGDANLDGKVDGDDYSMTDNGFNQKLTGWRHGSFDYGAATNGNDYSLIDTSFNTQATAVDPLTDKLENAVDVAQQQITKTVGEIGTSANYPQYTNPDGSWSWVSATHWTAGFFPGSLWQLYQATGNPYYLAQAANFTQPLSVGQNQTSDNGFRIFDSFDPLLLQQPGNASVIQIMLNAAAAKSTQYNATVGAFEAWRTSTSGNPQANFNVLMDLIMDSNLLFWAAKQSGNQTYYNQAVQNAITEETYLVRPDGGSAQFAYFNSQTGKFIDNETYEGYSATSTWSRGQAWGIYGFAMCYQQTGRADFLATSEKMANYFIAHLPADHIPYWDFNDPAIPNSPRDTSAAAVAASGLLQLSKLIASTDPTNSARYRAAAASILSALASPAYMVNPAAAGNGVLMHGALNVPAKPSIADNSIIFGDYYFLEAINEYLGT